MADDLVLESEEKLYEAKSAQPYLDALKHSEKQFDRWRSLGDRIDRIYSSLDRFNSLTGDNAPLDREFDLFWASVEVIKPSIYSRPPVPVVTPRFKDRSPVKRVTAELLERSAISGFEATDIDQVMLGVRDDLVIVGRGQLWVTYEDAGEEKICIEHLDRLDFLHDPARKWSEVAWVARRAWMTRAEMRERFEPISGALYMNANYSTKKEKDNAVYGADDHVEKAGVWELWDKVRKKVVWVTPGCEECLDQDDPHLKLKGYFPCPRPAYGTLQRKTLVPTPDMVRIESQLESINLLTVRIHDLVEKLVVKGIVPAGTDVGDAVETALRETDASYMLIPVPSMSMTDGAAVQWLPIDMVAQAILSAVEARRELIGNVQEIYGIPDIMRGDTQAQETFGAQQLKQQNGAVRTRDRVGELVRISRDAVCIMAEIMAEEFSLDTLLKMAQMELPTNAMIRKGLKEVEDNSKKQLDALEDKAEQELAQMQDPKQAEEAKGKLQEAQQAILSEANNAIAKLSQSVTEEQVKELLDDTKTDPFIFDIETDSTIYPDEMAEKQARAEFLSALANGMQALAAMLQTGGGQAAGEILKWSLAPYRPDRSVLMAIDEYVDTLASNPQSGADDATAELVAAQQALGQAELQKAQAQTMKVEADAQGKMQQIQLQAAEAAARQQADQQRVALEVEQTRGAIAETEARIAKIWAEIEAMGVNASNDTRQQDREDYKTVEQSQQNAINNAQQAESQAFDQAQQIEGNARADRGEDRADRQQDFNERNTGDE